MICWLYYSGYQAVLYSQIYPYGHLRPAITCDQMSPVTRGHLCPEVICDQRSPVSRGHLCPGGHLFFSKGCSYYYFPTTGRLLTKACVRFWELGLSGFWPWVPPGGCGIFSFPTWGSWGSCARRFNPPVLKPRERGDTPFQ